MAVKKVIITQSDYIPWKCYFDSFQLVDEVVLYDDMQYTRRDWRNRNKIKTPRGLNWLTIPVAVSGKYYQAIKDTKICDKGWAEKHWRTIKANYTKASCFKEYKDIFEELYLNCNEEYLSHINYRFLAGVNDVLGITTPMRFSSDFELIEGKTDRLIDLCKKLKATDYYTGPASNKYIDEELFAKANIKLHYFDYSGYPEYNQLYTPFTHNVSIIDLIFNVGKEAKQYMKHF